MAPNYFYFPHRIGKRAKQIQINEEEAFDPSKTCIFFLTLFFYFCPLDFFYSPSFRVT